MPLWKQFLAFGLGLIALFVGAFLEDAMGRLAAVIGMGAYFLSAQFLLSRGHPFAVLDDRSSIVVLNTPVVCLFFVAGGLGLLLLVIVTAACSSAGAMLASIVVQMSAERRGPHRRRAATDPSYSTHHVLQIHERKD